MNAAWTTATTAAANAEEQHANARVMLEEIVVTGSRLRLSDPEGPSPVTVFDRTKIDELGVTSVPELLRFLPQQPYSRPDFYRGDGAQFAELRGLGADMTLVLINGRRTVPSASSVSANAFDLNTIPLAAVERIEVLSDSASAVYGADALGGVVNIILRKEVTGTTVDLRYGVAEGGGDEQRVSVTAGLSGERIRGSIVLDYLRKDFLLGSERDRWNDQDFTRFGGTDQRSLNANPGNVTSRTAGNLPGLPSRFAAVPEGSAGIGLTPADFLTTAGVRNYESLLRWSSIVPRIDRASVAAFGSFDVLPALTLFAEAMYANRKTQNQSSPSSLSGTAVPATNAFNPFGVAISSNFLIEGLGPRRSHAESELGRGVVGARGPIGSWDWELSVMATRDSAETWTSNAADAAALAQALASSDASQALNVFQDGPGGSAELLSSLVSTPNRSEFASAGTQATGFVRGALAELPGGNLEVVVGGEWRNEDMHYDDFVLVDADRQVSAAFAEIAIPLVNEAMQWAAVHSLSLKLAGRYDDYSDFGQSTNPQYGLVWMPLRNLTLRASYGTSFRPPSLFELYAPRVTAPLSVNDPRRGNELVDTFVLTGGNPTLQPVEGESLTSGLVWTPLTGLRIATSWWTADLEERVSFFPYPLVLANEDRFPERIVRGTPSPADAALGWPGQIQSVDISRVNFGELSTDGVDVEATYAFDSGIGAWVANLSGTWVHEYRTGDTPDAAPVERVGIASVFGTIPEWRAVASLAWSRSGWSISATGRFVDAYDDALPLSTSPSGRRIPTQSLFDLQCGWDGDAAGAKSTSWKEGFRVTLGISNVFDKEPAYSQVIASNGYDTSQGDLRQRFGHLSLSKRF